MMMRLDRDEAGADGLIAQCLSSLPSALEVTSALLARHPERASSVEDLSRCVEYAQQVQATGIPRYPSPLPKLEGWPTEEDVQRREKRVAFNADLAARLELSLCVFGTFVSLVVRDLGVKAGDPLDKDCRALPP